MKKNVIWIVVGVVLVVAVIAGIIVCTNSKGNNPSNNGPKIETAEDMKAMIEAIYEKSMPESSGGFDTQIMDVSDDYTFNRFTGLKSNENVEAFVLSAPFINVNPYEFAVVKAKAGADIESMKQEMYDNLNMDMWICVSAEKLYITNYGDIIVVVMGREDDAKTVYNAFKEYVGNSIGKELEKTNTYNEEVELPPEMTGDTPVVDGVDTPVIGGFEAPVVGGIDTPSDKPVTGGIQTPVITPIEIPVEISGEPVVQ